MNINETVNLSANITVKDANGTDTVVANLSVNSLDATNMNLSINVNTYNKALLTSEGAVNVAGETVVEQYTQFETAVKAKAKGLGYVIFG
jgi:outer membrane protein TolC